MQDSYVVFRQPLDISEQSARFQKTIKKLDIFAIKFVVMTIFIAYSLLFPVYAAIQDISQSAQVDVNITLYPKDLALIKEKRKTFLKEGANKLLIKDIPLNIIVDSFIFQIPYSSIKLLEYNFQTPDITRNALLQHSIGENVKILPSQLIPLPDVGKLIAVDGEDCIVESMGQIFALKKNRIVFSRLPYTMVSEPIITLKLTNPKEGDYFFTMGYLAKGFTWDAGYTIVLDSSKSQLDLNNWINIHNKSGMDIKKGHFLVAHVQDMGENFYDIEKPITLADNAVKNISWFSAQGLTPTTSFRLFPKNNITKNEEGVIIKPVVETWLSVQNDSSHGLGIPLPEGVIKVFRRLSSGSLFYVGENKTPFISVGKALSLRVGSTKAITAEMRQTDYRKLGSQVVESGYRLDLKNESKSPKKVTVFQDVVGDWSILRETHPHEEEETRLQWTLTLASQEEVSLRYRIRVNVK